MDINGWVNSLLTFHYPLTFFDVVKILVLSDTVDILFMVSGFFCKWCLFKIRGM